LGLPWQCVGAGDVGRGRWTSGGRADEFVSRVEKLVPEGAAPLVLELAAGPRVLKAFLSFDGELVRAEGPGRPGDEKRQTLYVMRTAGRSARLVTVLESVGEAASVRAVRAQGGVIEVETAHGVDRHTATALGWEIATSAGRIRLAGARAPEPPLAPLLELEKPTPVVGAALRVSSPPPLDGMLDGFDTSEPLRLELEDQYRRSEEPYPGPDDFAAVAHAAWDDDALYLAVDVVKPELCIRPGEAPPLRLDNEPDDIHSDGLQVYVAGDGGGDGRVGYLVVPETGATGLRGRATSDTSADPGGVRGAGRRTDRGCPLALRHARPAASAPPTPRPRWPDPLGRLARAPGPRQLRPRGAGAQEFRVSRPPVGEPARVRPVSGRGHRAPDAGRGGARGPVRSPGGRAA